MRLLHFLIACFLVTSLRSLAQQPPQPGVPVTLQNAPQRDTTNRAAKADWHNEPVTIYSHAAFSAVRNYLPDTGIHNFHRRQYLQPYYRDLGNHGSPARSQLFIPENLGHTGPSLGYRVYDVYRFKADSLQYFNTTRPYTSFSYQLGSKLEQTARLMHTQNISPGWNFMVRYQKISSPGFYRLQRTNHDAGGLTTHYTSSNQRYQLYGAVVYNKEQSDENGGILGDSLLDASQFGDLQTIPVALDNPNYTGTASLGRRSSFTNTLRDVNLLLRHQYTLGRQDTLYNADSTQYSINLVPRFSVGHRLELGSEKHRFRSLAPRTEHWAPFFNVNFNPGDSVFTEQFWSWVDNRFLLSGFVGRGEQQLAASAGIGNRVDGFYTDYDTGREQSSIISTYVTGDIRKEALKEGAWGYAANAKFFIAGASAGNFLLSGMLSKDFGRRIGTLAIGAAQQLTDAPYAYTVYRNAYYEQRASLNKESITSFYGELRSPRFGLVAGLRNYILSNYIYLTDDSAGRVINGPLVFSQAASAFTVTQITARKIQRLGRFVIDVDGAFQGTTGDAPLFVPAIVGRASFSYESPVFRGALHIATGIDLRYHTRYTPEGYSPFYNRFYYQTSYTAENPPEGSVFFNFRVKRFRSYLMFDQVQALFLSNTVIHPGYPAQNFMIRFGFEWVMVN